MLIVVFLTIFMVVIGCWIVTLYKKKGYVGSLCGFLAAILVFYIAVPILIIILQLSFKENINIYGFSDFYKFIFEEVSISNYLRFIINFLIAIVGLYYGYRCKFTLGSKSKERDAYYEIDIERYELKKMRNITLIVGLSTLLLYVYGLGGIESALGLGEQLRGFSSTIEVNAFLTLAKIPAAIVVVSFYLSVLVIDKKESRIQDYIILVISFIFSIIFLLIKAGRTAIIMLFLFVIFTLIRKQHKNPWIIICIIGIIALPLLETLDNLFSYMSYGYIVSSSNSLLVSILKTLRQLSYPFQIQLHCNDITDEFGFLYFKNFFTDILGMLPGISFEQSYERTSAYFMGIDWKKISGVPNDVISYGYLNLGYLGVFIIMCLWGQLLKYVDKWLDRITLKDNIRDSFAFVFAGMVFTHVISADLQAIIQGDIAFTVLILFIISNNKKKHKI